MTILITELVNSTGGWEIILRMLWWVVDGCTYRYCITLVTRLGVLFSLWYVVFIPRYVISSIAARVYPVF